MFLLEYKTTVKYGNLYHILCCLPVGKCQCQDLHSLVMSLDIGLI